jgi:hypothetical protein
MQTKLTRFGVFYCSHARLTPHDPQCSLSPLYCHAWQSARSYTLPSAACTGSVMTSWVMGQQTASGSSTMALSRLASEGVSAIAIYIINPVAKSPRSRSASAPSIEAVPSGKNSEWKRDFSVSSCQNSATARTFTRARRRL